MSYQTILYEVSDRVAKITLNRPEKLNAWSPEVRVDMTAALRAANADDGVRAVVICGAGRAFCAGMDLKPSSDKTFARAQLTDAELAARDAEYTLPYQISKPVIAAIHGPAVGVGITYPMLADIRIASETAKIQYAMVRRGILPELGSHVILPRVLGFSKAAELLLTGRMLSGTEAAEMGLVSRAVPAADVLPVAMEMARDIAVNTAPVSVALAKRLLWEGLNTGVDEMIAAEGRIINKLASSPDSVEGVRAFFEKRTPEWSMKVSSDMDTYRK